MWQAIVFGFLGGVMSAGIPAGPSARPP
jgi:hypothetical protein